MKPDVIIRQVDRTDEWIQELSQWVIISGFFFANRIELLCVIFVVLILGLNKKVFYTSTVLKYMLAVYAVSFITITWLGYDYRKFIQQAILLTIFLLCYEQFFYHHEKRIESLFIKYIKMSFYISVFGLIQELIFMITGSNIASLLPFYHQSLIVGNLLRVTSTLSEGGYLGTILIPCLVYLFYYNDPFEVLGKKKWLICIVSLLTFSPFVYVFFIVLFFIKLKNKLHYFKILSVIAILYAIVYSSVLIYSSEYESEAGGVEGLLMRYKDTISMIDLLRESDIEMENLVMLNTSTAVMYTNLYVSMMAPSRIFGTGLGTHAQNHSMIIDATFDEYYSFMEYNVEDGYSLMVRLLSELGICGIILYIFFIVKCFNKENFMNICFFFILCCFFIRGGSYVDFGTIFFHFAYFITSRFNLSLEDVKTNFNNYCDI